MSTISKERLEQLASGNAWVCVQDDEAAELARIAMASLEAEPVAYIRDGFRADGVHFCGGIITAEEHERTKPALSERYTWKHQPLYTAPPAPVSVPAAMEMDDDFDSAFENGKAVGWNACRDAMLKHSEPFIVTSDHRMMEMPQVEAINAVTAMLQGVEPVTTAYKLQDGWVACSELMPEQFKAILAFNEYGEVWSGAYDRYWNFYCDNLLVEHVTHWMPLPAAPQQEA
ncbi:TPA: DUF551 domain-containing protein [Enterobacter cloacae]